MLFFLSFTVSFPLSSLLNGLFASGRKSNAGTNNDWVATYFFPVMLNLKKGENKEEADQDRPVSVNK